MLVRLKPDTTYAQSGGNGDDFMRTHRWLVSKPADYSRLDRRSTKRRSGLADLVRPTPVGSIAAHEAIVIGQLRAFFRGANRRSA